MCRPSNRTKRPLQINTTVVQEELHETFAPAVNEAQQRAQEAQLEASRQELRRIEELGREQDRIWAIEEAEIAKWEREIAAFMEAETLRRQERAKDIEEALQRPRKRVRLAWADEEEDEVDDV